MPIHYVKSLDETDDRDVIEQRFKINTNMTNKKFEQLHATEMKGECFTMEYVQKHGFSTPTRFVDKHELGEAMVVTVCVICTCIFTCLRYTLSLTLTIRY